MGPGGCCWNLKLFEWLRLQKHGTASGRIIGLSMSLRSLLIQMRTSLSLIKGLIGPDTLRMVHCSLHMVTPSQNTLTSLGFIYLTNFSLTYKRQQYFCAFKKFTLSRFLVVTSITIHSIWVIFIYSTAAQLAVLFKSKDVEICSVPFLLANTKEPGL